MAYQWNGGPIGAGEPVPVNGDAGRGIWDKYVAPIIPVVGSVAGGIIDKASQDATNKANAQNVDKQIAFQKEQSETQYQRAVADMRAAGLNPALAYKQGGNQSGSGAAAENRAVMHGARMAQAIDAYNAFANGSAQRQLMREQAGATAATARLARFQGDAAQPDAILGTSADYIGDYTRARTAQRRGEKYTAEKTEETYMANLRATNQGTATARQQERLMGSQQTLNEQQFQNKWFRENIAPYINSTAKAMEGVDAIARTAKGVTGFKPITKYY